jgi:hypothetical protein
MAGVRNADISVLNYNFITADSLLDGDTPGITSFR